jgi:hypothetical protein
VAFIYHETENIPSWNLEISIMAGDRRMQIHIECFVETTEHHTKIIPV